MKKFMTTLAAFSAGSLFLLLLSCESMGSVLSAAGKAGAAIAEKSGKISSSTANAISNAAESTGQALNQATATITPEQQYYIGRAVAANILTHYSLDTKDVDLTNYLNEICNTITINSAKPDIYNGYHVAILDSSEINAFSTPGGHIFITKGLLACTNSEDTIAAVLAHEISHIQLGHALSSIKSSRWQSLGATVGTNLADVITASTKTDLSKVTSVFNSSVNDIVSTLLNSGYSQTQEFAADSNALKLLAQAGYNPDAMLTMLKGLEKGEQGKSTGFVKTHPSPEARIANVNKTLGNYQITDTSAYRSARYKQFNEID
jgi:predicted Zn-dependent protease